MPDPGTERAGDQPSAEGAAPVPAPDALQTVSDEMLLLGARLRDANALATLYDRYGGLVFTLALRIVGDRARAEEIMHDVFLHCWHGQEQYDAARGTCASWLVGLTRSRALGRPWRRQPQSSVPEGAPPTQPRAPSSAGPGVADEAILRATVSRALGQLPEPERAAIELAYYGGLTQTAAADRLSEPPEAVRARIRDGLRRLHGFLAPLVDGPMTAEGRAP